MVLFVTLPRRQCACKKGLSTTSLRPRNAQSALLLDAFLVSAAFLGKWHCLEHSAYPFAKEAVWIS
jgi:hypothetical protein